MLELLSDVLRLVLRAEGSHETPLSTELDFLARYLAIEQVRFSARLRPRVEVDAAIRRAAVPQVRGVVAPPGIPKENVAYWEDVFLKLTGRELRD